MTGFEGANARFGSANARFGAARAGFSEWGGLPRYLTFSEWAEQVQEIHRKRFAKNHSLMKSPPLLGKILL